MKERVFFIGNSKTRVIFATVDKCLDTDKDDAFFIFDKNTYPLFSHTTVSNSIIIPAGEDQKNWNSIDKITSSALKAGLARDSIFVGVGGGVVCDLTGAAASLYMRGAGLILVPTTLLAMTDAALGGKTGFDYGGYKNILGTFYPAAEIRICPEVLTSLSEREFKNGLAEVIKHALLRDKILFDLLFQEKEAILAREPEIITALIDRSLSVKGWYVEQDFREKGVRAHLNYGHTFGHALESVTGFTKISHGEAVIWGIKMALKTGIILNKTDISYMNKVEKLINLYEYKTDYHIDLSADKLIAAMTFDKKKKAGQVRFVLQYSHGETFTMPVNPEILKKTLE